MTEDQILHHIQTTFAPRWGSALLEKAGITELIDQTQKGAFLDDGTHQLPWQTMVTPIVFTFIELERLQPTDLEEKLAFIRSDILKLFKREAGGRTICFQVGYRFRAFPFKMVPCQLVKHTPLVSRFAVLPAEEPTLSQIIQEHEEYKLVLPAG